LKKKTTRYRIAQNKLGAFNPAQLQEYRAKPLIKTAKIGTRKLPSEYIDLQREIFEKDGKKLPNEFEQKHIYVQLSVKNISPASDSRIYIRFEHGGKLQIGKFVLAEEVTHFKGDSQASADQKETSINFFLTGPKSPISGFIFNNMFEFGGLFQVSFAASKPGGIWGNERTLRFNYLDGSLRPPE